MAQDAKPAGWIVRATGNTDDPAAHVGLLAELRAVLSDPKYGCGSSEFNGPHAAESNFHANTATDEDSVTGAAVTDTAQSTPGEGYPSANPGAI